LKKFGARWSNAYEREVDEAELDALRGEMHISFNEGVHSSHN